MRSRLQAWTRPRSANEQKARKEFLLNVTVFVVGALAAGIALLSGMATLVFESVLSPAILVVSATAAFACYIAYRLGRQGYLVLAGYIPSAVFWAIATGVLAVGGWHTSIAVSYVLAVGLATLLNGLVGGIVTSVASLAIYGTIGWQFSLGMVPIEMFPSPEKLWLVNTMILGITMGGACALLHVLDRQLATTSAKRVQEMRLYADELEEVAREREQLVFRLQKTTQEQEQLLVTMRKISAPVLPLFKGLIVMPLVGQLDSERTALLLDDMLRGIRAYDADYVLLDVTGVPSMSSASAQNLLQAVNGARMLGSECKLVGVQPAVAQELVQLDIDLAEIPSYSTLREGLSDLLSLQ
ncbi:MAG: STAS domain-containing protein [Anaerolineae bacterium]|nr:STAS domain-containing protein [Anaerolineae bacterium]